MPSWLLSRDVTCFMFAGATGRPLGKDPPGGADAPSRHASCFRGAEAAWHGGFSGTEMQGAPYIRRGHDIRANRANISFHSSGHARNNHQISS